MADIDHKCSIRLEDDKQSKNIDKCSSNDKCYEIKDGKGVYLNSKCNKRESCGKYIPI